MEYMMLIYLDENSLSDADREKCYGDSAEYARELAAQGKCTMAQPLYPTSTATSIRCREGKRVITDGPFAETREQLGGIFVIDAADLDEAIEIAGKIPAGRWGTVEVRPMVHLSNVPQNMSRAVDSGRPHST